MFIYQSPSLIRKIFPQLTWEIPQSKHQNKYVYFTFDDGPTPEITNFVLEELHKFQARATFFCIGKNIVENPALFKQIIDANCTVGNHTMNHLNAWKVSPSTYQTNRELCENLFNDFGIKSVGFRPPYGRINKQIIQSSENENIFLWTLLTGDYRPENCSTSIIKNSLHLIKPGSIIVFHDSVKAFHNLKRILPAFLAYCNDNNLIPSTL